jgi:hypothetical protein
LPLLAYHRTDPDKVPVGIDTTRLIQTDAISLSWNEQRQRLGFPAHR